MGCSNPHPHGQIWSSSSIPVEPIKEQVRQLDYYQRNGRSLLTDYIDAEPKKKSRVIFENEHFVAFVSYWAIWPFEAMLATKRRVANLLELTDTEKQSFAAAYRELIIVYDNLFEVSFPYSAGIHQSPIDGKNHQEWHLHMHFYPPLLRSASEKIHGGVRNVGQCPARHHPRNKCCSIARAVTRSFYDKIKKH